MVPPLAGGTVPRLLGALMTTETSTAAGVTVPGSRLARAFGNVKADGLERRLPGYVRQSFVDTVLNSDWPE
ncbi:hypothetical protein GCM10010254_20950 [Streptomyces chromofuscus]|nr:hypothetical protein GCM10010254_20950 [Streptomyces chromofuscus]